MDSDATLEQVNILLFIQQFISICLQKLLRLVSSVTISRLQEINFQKSAVSKLFAKSNQLMKIFFQERFSNPSVDSSVSLQVFLLFFGLDPTASDFPCFFLFPEDLDCRTSEFPDFKFPKDLDRRPSEDFSFLFGRDSTK